MYYISRTGQFEADMHDGSRACVSEDVSELPQQTQKAYRSYRTRRKLADSAVVVEELWWQALDFARLNHNTISFFDEPRRKTAALHWNRISQNVLKVGEGLSRDDKALMLAFEHWIEAIDSRHRSGHNLRFYYNVWCQSQAGQPFFYWLDVGGGKDVDLPECPRTLLKKQCIRYLGPRERELYEYIIKEGKIIHKQSGEPLDTSQGTEAAYWIFVMSTARRLYAGKKEKGVFQHSSFLAGGATIAAGKFIVRNGVIKSIWAYSGHYKPSAENLSNFMKVLVENGVDVKELEMHPFTKEYGDDPMPNDSKSVVVDTNTPQVKPTFQRTISGGLHSPRAIDIPRKAILERIKSKSESESYQLGHKVSLQWSTGAGPRIGCVKDYPAELRNEALEMVDLSSTGAPKPSASLPQKAGR
ncbi:hypothetical protein U9M48_005208 [Paspalum notatum var. saurae]|uniref:Uncharacterized protein n=1 Tax=Paspalum notatum var. saurae TaxID=547442 RepID=A0AAQ3SJP6_PASNO